MAAFGSTKFASDLRDCKRAIVSNEFSSDENHETQTRRAVLSALAAIPSVGIAATAYAALAGDVVGVPAARANGPDLRFVAEEYLRDAMAVGIWFTVGSDGALWRGQPVTGSREDFAERDRITARLEDRPRLREAVIAAVMAVGSGRPNVGPV